MNRKIRELFEEMVVGILLYNGALGLASVLFCSFTGRAVMPAVLGVMLGMGSAVLMLLNMSVVVEKIIDSSDPHYARRLTVLHSVLRKGLYAFLLLFILLKVPQVSAVTLVLGTLGIKAGAYLQPKVHQFMERWQLHQSAGQRKAGIK